MLYRSISKLFSYKMCLIIIIIIIIIVTNIYLLDTIIIIIISVLPKGRSFTANLGTKAAVLPKGRYSTANSGTKVAVLLGMNRCGSFRWFLHPTLSLASEQTLKDRKSFHGHQRGVRRVDLANWALRTRPKLTTGVK